VLITAADRLRQIIQAPNLVARMGGDEFSIVYRTGDDLEASLRLAKRVAAALREPMLIEGGTPQIGGSVGAALYPADGTTPEELVHNADCAMYHSKAMGRGAYSFFHPEMDQLRQDRSTLERELDLAISERQIVPCYQQLVELSTGRVIGHEVLARWLHPRRGVLAPCAGMNPNLLSSSA
jgi:predicted signal transduction protein with EAL and GGDEF domain